MFNSINKTFGCCSKIFVAATKNLIVVLNFVAVPKPFFSVRGRYFADSFIFFIQNGLSLMYPKAYVH